MSIDSAYYPGVVEYIARQSVINQTIGAGVHVEYTNRVGEYEYYDSEGSFSIYDKKGQAYVKSTPKDNSGFYEHPIL